MLYTDLYHRAAACPSSADLPSTRHSFRFAFATLIPDTRGMELAHFPIDLKALKDLKLDPKRDKLSADELTTLKHNVQLCRDAIVFFTALAGARGLSGHTGGRLIPCLR